MDIVQELSEKEKNQLKQQRKATYYRIVKGEVEELPNLPADPVFMARYLAKGFTLTRPTAKPQTVTQVQEGFTCEVCGKTVSSKLALAGHKRSHKNTVGGN